MTLDCKNLLGSGRLRGVCAVHAHVWVCPHMHVLLCMRAVIAPVRADSSCEELVSIVGSVPPTGRVWSHSGLAKYTAAGSLISAADISKQHKNVGAVPPLSLLLPLCGTGLAWPTSLHGQHPGNECRAALGPRGNTHSSVHHMYSPVAFWGACVGRCGL